MDLKKITLTYLVSYLIFGGIGLTFFPALFLEIFQSSGNYGNVMPRVAGMFMLALGGLVGSILYYKDYKYYKFSIIARTIIAFLLYWFFLMTDDPFFLIIKIIVLIGLVPSYFVLFKEVRSKH